MRVADIRFLTRRGPGILLLLLTHASRKGYRMCIRMQALGQVAFQSPDRAREGNGNDDDALAAATVTADRERAAKAMAARLSNKILVGGKLVNAVARGSFPVENPATAEVIGHAPRCGAEDVEWAVTTARSAFAAWSVLPARQRSALILDAAQRLEQESEALAQLSALETGNALATQTRGEAKTMVDILRFFAGLASEMKGQTVPWTQNRFLYTKRVPVGVVGGIIPWNAPLMQTASKIGPALAAGNTIVLKTAEQAPLAVLRCSRSFRMFCLPASPT